MLVFFIFGMCDDLFKYLSRCARDLADVPKDCSDYISNMYRDIEEEMNKNYSDVLSVVRSAGFDLSDLVNAVSNNLQIRSAEKNLSGELRRLNTNGEQLSFIF